MRRPLIYAAAALVLLFVMMRATRPDHRIPHAKEARADSLYVRVLDSHHASAREKHERGLKLARYQQDRDSIRRIADGAAYRRPRVVERIEQVAGDSAAVIEAVRELEIVHATEVNALRAELLIADHMLAEKDTLIALEQKVNADLWLALHASRSEAREWEEAAKGPRLLGLFRVQPTTALVVGVVAGGVGAVMLTRSLP